MDPTLNATPAFGPQRAGYSQASSSVGEIRSLMKPSHLSGLKFFGDPLNDGSYVHQPTLAKELPRNTPFSLLPGAPTNREHLARENRLRVIVSQVELWPEGPERQETLRIAKLAAEFFETQKLLAWTRQRNTRFADWVDADRFYLTVIPHSGEPFLAGCFMATLLLSVFGSLTQQNAKALLAGFRTIAASSPHTQHLVRLIPKDVRDVLSKYSHFDPIIEQYLTCPSCFEQYRLSDHTAESLPFCTYTATPTSHPCRTSLWKTGGRSKEPSPVLTTAIHNFKKWLGSRLADPRWERACETAYQTLGRDPMEREGDGTRLQELRNEHGAPWLPGPSAELRLVFMWSADGWNPLGNIISGKQRTSTGIWLVNMSLGVDERYLPENVFLFCTLPGHPNGSRLNPTLALLVNVFKEFWAGVQYSRTALRPAGRVVKAAVVQQVSDVVASRQGAGRGAVNVSEFCMFCMLKHEDIECSDRSRFVPRNEEQQREWATEWRNAPSEQHRRELEEAHDIRDTPFYDLAYHIATLDNIPESMHFFYEHVIQDLIRRCFRLHLIIDDKERSEDVQDNRPPRPTLEASEAAFNILRAATDRRLSESQFKKLTDSPRAVLFHLCEDLGLRHAGTKLQLAKNLQSWRLSVPDDDPALKSIEDEEEDPTMAVDDAAGTSTVAEGASVSSTNIDASSAHERPGFNFHRPGAVSLGQEAALDPAAPEPVPWWKSLELSEMEELCSLQAKTIREAFNNFGAPSSINNLCSGELSILRSFAKFLSIDQAPPFTQRSNRTQRITAIKERMLAGDNEGHVIFLPDVREYLQPILSGDATNHATTSSTTAQSKARYLKDILTPEEQELMRSPAGVAIGAALIRDSTPNSIYLAAGKHPSPSVTPKRMLQVYCKSFGLSTTGKNANLISRLQQYVEDTLHAAPTKAARTDPEGERRAILNTALVEYIKHYQQRTQLPTSHDTASLSWGTRGHGRVSAHDWMMLGLVHLPVALIPKWGRPSSTPDEKALLKHLMTMNSFVIIGTLRSISVADTHDFDDIALALFEGKKALFPDETMKPYDHIALHFGEVLRRCGPTATHDGSYFERNIRYMHSINTNMQPGELEETYMMMSGRNANLRHALLQDNAFSTLAHTSLLVEEFRRNAFLDKRGTKLGTHLLASLSMFSTEGAQFLREDTSPLTLSAAVLDALPPECRTAGTSSAPVLKVDAASYGGARYCRASVQERDSDIVFLPNATDRGTYKGGRIASDRLSAGRISVMFLHGHSSSGEEISPAHTPPSRSGTLWAVVHPYPRLSSSESHLDEHYRDWEFGGFCCKRDLDRRNPVVINITQVVSQVAKTPVKNEGVSLFHFIPLNRLTHIKPYTVPKIPDAVVS